MVTVIRAVLVQAAAVRRRRTALIWVYTDSPPYRLPLSVVDYRALEATSRRSSHVAAYQTSTVTVTDGAHRERVHGAGP